MNLKGFIFVNFLVAIFLICGLNMIEEAEASEVESSVIGISFNSENSTLNIGIRESERESIAFKFIDWNIYGTGIAYYSDGETEKEIELNGYTVFRAEYSPGETVSVSFEIGDTIHAFDLRIQSSGYTLVSTEDDQIIEIGSIELSQRDVRNIVIGAGMMILGFFVALKFARRSAEMGDDEI